MTAETAENRYYELIDKFEFIEEDIHNFLDIYNKYKEESDFIKKKDFKERVYFKVKILKTNAQYNSLLNKATSLIKEMAECVAILKDNELLEEIEEIGQDLKQWHNQIFSIIKELMPENEAA